MIIKTVVLMSEETDLTEDGEDQSDSEIPVLAKYVESPSESKCHFNLMNDSFRAETDSCTKYVQNSTKNSANGASEDCPTGNISNDVLDDVINAEILHNLCTKLTGFPADSYSCGNCGEMFLSKSGCDQHLNRKSVHIVHSCTDCGRSIEFFNRCKFLIHIKGHGIIPTAEFLKCTTEFNVIAESKYLNFEYGERDDNYQYYNETVDNCNPTIFKTEDSSGDGNGSASEINDDTIEAVMSHSFNIRDTCSPKINPNLQNDSSDNSFEMQINTDYDQQGNDYWCSCCRNNYFNPEDFFHHIEENEARGETAKTLYQCNIDNIPSFSHCKYVLHNRVIHGKYGPFVCPECGQCFDGWINLYDHAKSECFHFSQSVLYSCVIKNCGQNEGAKELCTKSTLLTHFEKEHCRHVLQCVYCTRAFATYEWLFKHLLSGIHSLALSELDKQQLSSVLAGRASEEPTDAKTLTQKYSKKLIQCLICNVVFYNDSSYNQHFSAKFGEHSDFQLVFTCETCLEKFHKKSDFKDHLSASSSCNSKLNDKHNHSGTVDETNNSEESSSNAVPSTSEKTCKISSRTYRPRPKPLRIQPTRAAAASTIPLVPNPNYALTTLAGAKNGSFLRAHITQKCHYCRKNIDLNALKKHESTCSKVQLDPGYCLACSENYQGSLLLWYHGKNHLKNGLTICLFCNNRDVKFGHGRTIQEGTSDQDILEEHLNTFHVSNTKLPFRCALCKDTISDKDEVYMHLKKHHNLSTMDSFKVKRSRSFQISQLPRLNISAKGNSSGKNPLKRDSSLAISQNGDNDGKKAKKKKVKCETTTESKFLDLNSRSEDENNFELETDTPGFEKHNANQSDTKPIPFVPLVTTTQNARSKEGVYSCFKCPDYSGKTEDEFCEHIRQVHILGDQEEVKAYNGGIGVFPVEIREFWCPECDISYVVKPSLVKHLKFSHTYIQDVEDYMKKIGYNSKRPLKQHQCEICYLRCSDSNDHYNHMKSHGMAFLRLRQQRKATDTD